jgi:hypothetical protein
MLGSFCIEHPLFEILYHFCVRLTSFSLWIKPTDALSFKFIWYQNSTYFGQLPCPSSGVLHCTSRLVHYCSLTSACYQGQVGITTLHVSGSFPAHRQEFCTVHRHWYTITAWRPLATRGRMELCSIQPLVASCNSVPVPRYSAELLMIGREVALVHYCSLATVCYQGQDGTLFHPAPGSKLQ